MEGKSHSQEDPEDEMYLSAWNVHGFSARKIPLIEELMGRCDLLFVTETWKEINDYDDWKITKSMNREVRNTGPTCGAVMIIVQHHVKFNLRLRISTRTLQAIVGTLMSIPIVGCYFNQRTSVDQLEIFLNNVNKWLRGPVS